MTCELVRFAIGKPKKVAYGDGKEMVSGICKESVKEALLSKDGFVGDGVGDLRFHGGPDRAVCVYPEEHYGYWEKQFGHPLEPSTFGENLTVRGMLEKDVHIGDIYQVGEAVIQVTQGRVPCSTITKRTGLKDLMKKMIQTGYTGYLCRVLREGNVRSDSPIILLGSHHAGITILYCNEIYYRHPKDIDSMGRILAVDELAEEWKQDLQQRIEKQVSSAKS